MVATMCKTSRSALPLFGSHGRGQTPFLTRIRIRGRQPPRAQNVLTVVVGLVLVATSVGLATGSYNPMTSLASHAPIGIAGNGDFNAINGVTRGDGTSGNPFVIEGWDITTACGGEGIRITGTTAYFVVRNINVTLPGTGCSNNGVALLNVLNGVVEKVSLTQGFAEGIVVSGGHDLTLRSNDLFAPISINQSPNVTISDNKVTGSSGVYSIDLWVAENVNVSGNYVTGSGASLGGIHLGHTRNIVIANNVLVNNWRAIVLESANDTAIRGNDVSKSGYVGLEFDSSQNVTLVGNTLSHGQGAVISGTSWSGLTAFHNNIYGNMYGTSAGDRFDNGYPSGGNYWSAYVGSDECSGPDQALCGRSDGIGDTPRKLGDVDDRFPLMEPFGAPFQLNVSGSPGWCVAPCSARFGARVQGGVLPYTFAWNFADGRLSSLSHPEHVYENGGTYRAVATVTDASGRSAEAAFSITVAPGVSTSSGTPSATVIIESILLIAIVVVALAYYARIRRRQWQP